MNCIEVRKILSLCVDNMLEGEQRAEVMSHLDDCDACNQEYQELLGITALLNSVEDVPLPSCFDERFRAALAGEKAQEPVIPVFPQKKKNHLWKKLSSIAAIFVIGIFSVVMYNHSNDVIPLQADMSQQEAVVQTESSAEARRSLKTEIVKSKDYQTNAIGQGGDTGKQFEAPDKNAKKGAMETEDSVIPETTFSGETDTATTPASNQILRKSMPGQTEVSSGTAMDSPTRHFSPEGNGATPASLKSADSTMTDARDSVAITYYLKLMEKELHDLNYKILSCAQDEDHAWVFNIEITSADEFGKETIEARTYIGRDGNLWIKE